MLVQRKALRLLEGVSAIAMVCGLSEAVAADVAQDELAPQEIVVTAQRRSAKVNDVAAAINVLSGQQLQQSGVTDSMSLQTAVPGLIISRETALTTQIFIRGIGNNLTGISASNSVATYVDGVYVANSIQALQRFNDVERVEVLKGPQAVLYGRNATGGAILVVSKNPEFEPSFSADASYGNYDAYEVRGSATGALIGDVVAGRISVRSAGRDGYDTDLTSGIKVDREQALAIRGSLLFQLTPDLSIKVQGDHSYSQTADFLKAANRDAWMYVLNPSQYSSDPRSVYNDTIGRSRMMDDGGLVNVKWSNSWGDLNSVTSYRDFSAGPTFGDLDGTAGPLLFNGATVVVPVVHNGDIVGSEAIWHETYFSTDSSKAVSAIFGFNYFHENSKQLANRITTLVPSVAYRAGDVDAYSLFADLSWNITPRWRLGAGVRYNWEERSYASQPVSPVTLGNIGTRVSNRDTYNSTNPRAGLEFRPTDGELWFLNYTTGFKSGGFNEGNPADSFEPEKVWSVEGGVKKSWAGGRLQTNLSGYYYDYSDLQVQRITYIPVFARQIDNAKSATLYGLDFEISGTVTDGLRLGANFSYLHSEYGELVLCNDLILPCTNPASQMDAAGNQMIRAPELSGSIFGDYKFTVGALPGSFNLHLDTTYTGKTYFAPWEADVHARQGFWLINGEFRYEPTENYYMALYAANITDELYEQHIVATGRQYAPGTNTALGAAPHQVRWGSPRTFGVRLGVSF